MYIRLAKCQLTMAAIHLDFYICELLLMLQNPHHTIWSPSRLSAVSISSFNMFFCACIFPLSNNINYSIPFSVLAVRSSTAVNFFCYLNSPVLFAMAHLLLMDFPPGFLLTCDNVLKFSC